MKKIIITNKKVIKNILYTYCANLSYFDIDNILYKYPKCEITTDNKTFTLTFIDEKSNIIGYNTKCVYDIVIT